MKKIITSFIAATAALAAWADAPVLLFRGEPVEAGKTYETGYTEDVFEMDGIVFMKSFIQDAHLTLTGTKGAQTVVEVKASEDVQVCSIDGQCKAGKDVTKQGPLGTNDVVGEDGNNVTVDLKIDKINDDYTGTADPASLVSTITVDVTAYYAASPTEKATATVVLRNVPQSELTGIIAVDSEGASVSLGYGNTLEYNAVRPTKLDIYTAGGSLVMSRKIYSSGSLSLDSLHPGVYIYSAEGTTGKIIVKK